MERSAGPVAGHSGGTSVDRAAPAVARPARREDPLLRNGLLLTASSLLTSVVGVVFWALAARWYSPEQVGRNYAAVAALMLLGGIGQLNLSNVLVRFVPPARQPGRLVLRAYLGAVLAAVLAGTGFVLLVPVLSPGLGFLHTPLLGAAFVVGAVGYALFELQDGVFTGLRRADLVIWENTGFAVLKTGLLGAFAAAGAVLGILHAWLVGLVVVVVVTNSYLFARAIPRHRPRGSPASPTPRYLAADLTGALCWQAAASLPPVLVLNLSGAAASAYFSVAWLVGYGLYQFVNNMGYSLTVESADERTLPAHYWRLLRHTGALLAAAVLVLELAAPLLLRVFGADYAAHGTTALRLLGASALPFLVTSTAVAVCRVRRRMRVAVTALVSLSTLVLVLTVLLVPRWGSEGAAAAWLAAQLVVAAGLLACAPWWRPARVRAGARRGAARRGRARP
ncbi:hypothetical protein C7C46_08145 [Streptomyces tateyamensis]|uniref:Uncharacterized protein n=1 Tax=Streptomyces tateyamensis TaxID=565073 RepID=A0A2V4NI48_9ACTN|nr:polysaccharide biosynthesis C-terminal domain-containing protein [Streptomyces tateyamensis]PYC84039.1 hypothetical protein C7C46_08145 [Streptomyces tateyamensis]